MGDRLNILVLHMMGDPRYWRTAVEDLEYMLPTYAPHHNYIVHAVEYPLPDYIKDIQFDGIVLGPTFLCCRHTKLLQKILPVYDFIRTSDAFKIAMPQDDYHRSAILDRWMVDWNVDLVYSVCPDHWSILYPNYIKKGTIKLGYTGYISNSWINYWSNPKPFEKRSIDISYRAKKSPPYAGSMGYLKGNIGDIFKAKVNNSKLILDISTERKDMIPGIKWHEFLENSKFCLATNSGSSLHDPEGLIHSKIKHYLAKYPKASFEEIERNCFFGEDGKHIFTAISPRIIEAALAETIQIAIPGQYSGILESAEHYIPLENDCSNVPDILSIMKHPEQMSLIAKKCKEAILSIDNLRFDHHVKQIIETIKNGTVSKRIPPSKQNEINRYIEKYNFEINKQNKHFWYKKRVINQAINLAEIIGIGRIVTLYNKGQ